MIGDLLSNLNTANRLSIEQIQRAVQDGTLPAYVGVPLLQQKMQQRQQAAALLAGKQSAGQPPIGQQIMDQASQVTRGAAPTISPSQFAAPQPPQQAAPQPAPQGQGQGLDSMPTNLPAQGFAPGGIVAFAEGSVVDSDKQLASEHAGFMDALNKLGASIADVSTAPFRGVAGAVNTALIRPARAITGAKIPYIWGSDPSYTESMTPYYDQLIAGTSPLGKLSTQVTAAPVAAPADKSGTYNNPAYDPTTGGLKEAPKGSSAKPSSSKAPSSAGVTSLLPPSAGDVSAESRPPIQPSTSGTSEVAPSFAGPTFTPSSTSQASKSGIDTLKEESDARYQKYLDMIMGKDEEHQKDLETNMWMQLLKGGLGIMGGSSPIMAQNVAAGAGQAASGVADLLQKEQARKAQQVKDIIALGMDKGKTDLELKRVGIQEGLANAEVQKYLFDIQRGTTLLPGEVREQGARIGLQEAQTGGVAHENALRDAQTYYQYQLAKRVPAEIAAQNAMAFYHTQMGEYIKGGGKNKQPTMGEVHYPDYLKRKKELEGQVAASPLTSEVFRAISSSEQGQDIEKTLRNATPGTASHNEALARLNQFIRPFLDNEASEYSRQPFAAKGVRFNASNSANPFAE